MASFEEQVQENHLTCVICQSFYDNPKALPCLHSFCEGCLRDYVFSRNYDAIGKFPCPICQQETILPSEGVQVFQTNHLLNSLLDTLLQNGQLQNDKSRSPKCDNGAPTLYKSTTQQPVTDNQVLPTSSMRPSAPSTYLRDSSNISSNQPSNRERNGSATTQGRAENHLQLTNFAARLGIPVQKNYHKSLVRFGKYGNGIVDFTKPVGLCVTGKNSIPMIHVTDQRDNRVMTFNLDGQVQTIFTCKGEIYDTASDRKDLLYIVNAKAARALACCYTVKGQRKADYGNLFTFESPHGITVTNSGNVIVSCPDSNKCYIMDPSGKMLHHFGKKGKGKDSFLNPLYIGTNLNNDILVSDYESNCIKVFDKMGKSKFTVGDYGCNKGELHNPLGVVCDHYGNIIVADSGNDRIQIFDSNGKYKHMFLTDINMQGFPLGSEVVPKCLALVRDRLIVLYTGNNLAEVRVYKYSYESGSKSCSCM